MSKYWKHNPKYNSYCLYCDAFPKEWACEERRPIAVLNVERRHKKERYTYSCFVVLNPGSLIPLKVKSVEKAKAEIEKAIIEYLEYKLDECLNEAQILEEEIAEIKGE
jgi:hypothetical protein|uniref:Pre-mRNA-processing-splicing factor 8, Thioredoxin-like protein, SPLICING n=1 Tax=Myoviridae sp. ct78050 TaxID=2826617 RepID=A0A8S5R1R5_9CAUD|nr:MAG TPA: Pre-mRNA-processing-splicing factor 8, Thioredoxin-like protein, SPLICING [Myoviridae sp. ct78050]